jgi:hypothetical protein
VESGVAEDQDADHGGGDGDGGKAADGVGDFAFHLNPS